MPSVVGASRRPREDKPAEAVQPLFDAGDALQPEQDGATQLATLVTQGNDWLSEGVFDGTLSTCKPSACSATGSPRRTRSLFVWFAKKPLSVITSISPPRMSMNTTTMRSL